MKNAMGASPLSIKYEIRLLSDADDSQWDAFVQGHLLSRCVFTSAGRAWCRQGHWPMDFIGGFHEGRLVAGAAVGARQLGPLPRSLVRVAAILPDSKDAAGSTAAVLREVQEYARSRRAWEIETRCGILDGYQLDETDYSRAVQEALADGGYQAVPIRGGTYVIRLDVDDETLLNSFSSKCRRDVRKGLREGVLTERLTSPESLDVFFSHQHQMRLRKNLDSFNEAVREALRPLYDRGHIKLFVASYRGRICNMALVDTLGVPQYWFGATTPAAFEKGTPPTGQCLHYEIMRGLRSQGCVAYDLGGSPGPEPEEGHPNYTVWRFKREFGGPFVYWMSARRRSLSRIGGWVLSLIRRTGRLPLPGRPVTADVKQAVEVPISSDMKP